MTQSRSIPLRWIDSGVKGDYSYFVADQLSPNQFLTDNEDIISGMGFLLTGLDCNLSEFTTIAERFLGSLNVQYKRVQNWCWVESDMLATVFSSINNSMMDGFFLSSPPTIPMRELVGIHVPKPLPLDQNLAPILSVCDGFYLTYHTIPELYIISRDSKLTDQLRRRYALKLNKLPA